MAMAVLVVAALDIATVIATFTDMSADMSIDILDDSDALDRKRRSRSDSTSSMTTMTITTHC